jgi:hypothetical protein
MITDTEPWITSDILECIYSRDKLYKKLQRSKNSEDENNVSGVSYRKCVGRLV